MKLRPALAAALLLPLVGFGASWAVTHRQAQQGTDWNVPIAGYDPRDLLRGHYIQYSYDWPGLADETAGSGMPWHEALCIEGNAPLITKVSRLEDDDKAKCASIVRAPGDGVTDLNRGRFYVPQTKALDYEKKLADPKLLGMAQVRIREDGVMTPKALKFRPLTAAEVKALEVAEAARRAKEMLEARERRPNNDPTAPPPPIIQ